MAINPTAMPPKTEAPAPEIAPEVLTGMKQYPFLKEQQAAGEKASEASIKSKLLKESTALEEKGKALEKISSEDKAYYQDIKGKMEKPPEFKPTQENAMELGSIFSLIGTMGVALGGSGKLSGLNALNAMGGMLKGWQQGKKDVFEKEQKIFDKEVARIKSVNEMLIKDLEQYQKLRVTDKEAALVQAQQIESKNPGVIAALLASGKADVAYEIAKKNTEIHTKIMELASRNSVSGKGGGSKSAINERFQNTVIRSANETLRSLELMENIGIDIGKGGLGGVVGKGTLASESIANITRYMTSQDQLRYNAAAGGMALELSYVMNGGYKPSEGQINELKNLYLATPQDTYETAAFKFADVVAKLKAAIEVAPAYTDQQKQNNQMLLQKVNRYATPEEILAKINGEQPKPDPYVRTPSDKTIARQGTVKGGPNDGKTKIEYTDGTTEYK